MSREWEPETALEGTTGDYDESSELSDAPEEKSGIVSGKVVKWTDPYIDVRELNAAAWKNVGSSTKMQRWHKGNGWQVDAADLDDAALAYCESEEGFVIVDADPKRVD